MSFPETGTFSADGRRGSRSPSPARAKVPGKRYRRIPETVSMPLRSSRGPFPRFPQTVSIFQIFPAFSWACEYRKQGSVYKPKKPTMGPFHGEGSEKRLGGAAPCFRSHFLGPCRSLPLVLRIRFEIEILSGQYPQFRLPISIVHACSRIVTQSNTPPSR